MRILFDVQHLYYLPHFEPVMQVLRARGAECVVIVRDRNDPDGQACRDLLRGKFRVEKRATEAAAVVFAQDFAADWIVVGNDNPYWKKTSSKSALIYHGIGVKSAYYHAQLMNVDLRFVEGPYRARELAALFPGARLEAVGFPKLDPLLNGTAPRFDLAAHGLDASRPTVLYAPTFFPSSIGRLSPDWPASLADCNLLIKPHQFSLTKPAYRAQQALFRAWQAYPNVFLADTAQASIVPFVAVADLLISEASSALFEFAALDRPVVWCDFLKLRWSYRGPFAYRLRRRMDQDIRAYSAIGAHADSPGDMILKTRAELEAPERHSAARQRITAELIGKTDGHAAERAADFLLAE